MKNVESLKFHEIESAIKELAKNLLETAGDIDESALEKTLEITVPALLELNPEVGTKKAAREAILSMLEVHGLVTQTDGKIEFLKRTKVQITPNK